MNEHKHFFVFDHSEAGNYISICRECGEIKATHITQMPAVLPPEPSFPSPWRRGQRWPLYPQVID